MSAPIDTPWIDEPGFWHREVKVGPNTDHTIYLSVGSRAKRDGTLVFQADVKPSALVPDAAAALQLTKYSSLIEAKRICDEIAKRIQERSPTA